MARMLASVQKVLSLEPIPGADRIELARILGWQVVVKRGDFQTGDVGVFFEIDSILPDKPCFEFMKERKFRVRTIRLKKQISQGLFMPFSDLGIKNYPEGKDLTDILGITKWEPPEDTGVYQNKKPKSWWWKLVYKWPILLFHSRIRFSNASIITRSSARFFFNVLFKFCNIVVSICFSFMLLALFCSFRYAMLHESFLHPYVFRTFSPYLQKNYAYIYVLDNPISDRSFLYSFRRIPSNKLV